MSEMNLFQQTSLETLLLLKDLNKQKKPIFVVPTKYISVESVQVGYLLNEFYSSSFTKLGTTNYKNFFCNSRYEALQGAIKIGRHYRVNHYRKHQGRVMIYDSDSNSMIKSLFHPIDEDKDHSLFPGISVVNDLPNAAEILGNKNYESSFAVCVLRMDNLLKDFQIREFYDLCRATNTVFVIDFSKCDLEESRFIIQTWNFRPDIFIMGEQLTNREIPFSVFSMTDRVYKPWNTLANSLLHSSTFGGNLLALTKAKQVLLDLKYCSDEVINECKSMETNRDKKYFYFSKYINGKLRQFYKLTGYDIEIKEASGCYFKVETSSGEVKKILDGVSGGGLGVFGHNPDDLDASVLSKHDLSHDYWADLSKELTSRTKFETVFPAVSGATAVEIGMTLCLSAQKQKKKMIVFQNNYAGKLLLPLVATTGYTYGGLKGNPSKIFQPLYSEVVVIDAFQEEADKQLLSEIRSGQVGLIWFEYIQGKVGKNIPNKIINIINKYKEDFGYYIGIDEILMGLYRSGSFFSYEGKVNDPDIVTFSKGLTYLTFPIGVTLVSEAVYSQAKTRNPNLVKQLEVCYKNQLAAHIACHCLARIDKENIAQHVQEQLIYLQNRLEEMRNQNLMFKEMLVNGLFFGVYSKFPWWLEIMFLFGGELVRGLYLVALTRCWIEEGVFVFVDTRLLPSLTLSTQEIDKFLLTAQKILNKRPSSVIFKALWKYIASGI